MNQIITQAIVLARTNYQESDRILTLLTPEYGKVRAMAKGVRKSKSKLAGGVELFSVSEIGFVRGKGELCMLTSARLIRHYDLIVQDINRTMLGYELIKLLGKVTEDQPETDYYNLLVDLFESLDRHSIQIDLISLWFYAQLLRIAGHTPNLLTDTSGVALTPDKTYAFSYDDMAYVQNDNPNHSSDQVKLLRLLFNDNNPRILQKIQNIDDLITPCLQIVRTILPSHIRT